LITFIFFFHDTATTPIYTLSLHDALPISRSPAGPPRRDQSTLPARVAWRSAPPPATRRPDRRRRCRSHQCRPDPSTLHRALSRRSEEHTSELQSRGHLVCRLLLEKKKRIV